LVEKGLTSTIAEEIATADTTPIAGIVGSCRTDPMSGMATPKIPAVDAKAEIIPPT
jgi:hypothetical protein